MYEMVGSRTSKRETRMKTKRNQQSELARARAIKKRGNKKSSFHLFKIMKMKILLDGQEIPCEVVGWREYETLKEKICLESDDPDKWQEELYELEKDHLIIKVIESEVK